MRVQSAKQLPVTTDPDIKSPTDYADAAPLEEIPAEPSQQEIDAVYSLADAARAAGAWSDDED